MYLDVSVFIKNGCFLFYNLDFNCCAAPGSLLLFEAGHRGIYIYSTRYVVFMFVLFVVHYYLPSLMARGCSCLCLCLCSIKEYYSGVVVPTYVPTWLHTYIVLILNNMA